MFPYVPTKVFTLPMLYKELLFTPKYQQLLFYFCKVNFTFGFVSSGDEKIGNQ